MSKGQQHAAGTRYARMLFSAGTVGGLTDGQLLERFTAHADESAELAFATLVERHGSMVLGVCRSVLHDPHEAHDSFQATFMVLVRRARSLWVRDSLGPWLHQVAFRVARSARSATARRRRHERRAAELTGRRMGEPEPDDLGLVLHAEVNRLPGGCRSAVVLCYFDGLSPEQAARQLGCPLGTVQSRLARGRARLRSRLARRGLAPAAVEWEPGLTAEATPAMPLALVEATIRAALSPSAGSAGLAASVVPLTQGVLRSMMFIKVRTIAASVISVAALAAGLGFMIQEAPAPRPAPNLDVIRAELGATELAPQREGLPETLPPPPPQGLAWNEVPLTERRRVVELLATQSRVNYEKIETWQGSYAYKLRQFLDKQFVAQALAGARMADGKPAAPGKLDTLWQEFDSALTFAVDAGADALYRDLQTSRMGFLTVATEEEVKVPNVGTDDHRSIVTPDAYFVFRPKERATSAFLPNLPEAQHKRRVDRFPVKEATMREGGSVDPRGFFKFDPGNYFWTGLELYAQAFRGELGADQKDVVEQRLKIGQADGPGGRWYRDQMGFGNPGQPMLWVTTQWSPQAGYNPVSMVRTLDKPDGKPESVIEWQWKVIDGIYVPSTIKESAYRAAGGQLSKQQVTRLKECAINQPLAPHQFDERGLGASDGDLVLNHLERVAYVMKGGEPVKLANFGDGSVMRQPRSKPTVSNRPLPKPAVKAVAGSDRQAPGKIYTTASLGTDAGGRPISSVVAVDPESGEVTKVFDNSPGRIRVAADGRRAAFVSGEFWNNRHPAERMKKSLWIRTFADGATPERVVRLQGTVETGGEVPVWSDDGKQLIVSMSSHDDSRNRWVYETFRINVDGSGREPLKISDHDGVQDWSSDGAWVVTTSSRNAKIGWQLYVMRPSGQDEHQITDGGNPFYARFSPDGKRVLYSDGPSEARLGIWVVDREGTNRRRLFATGKETASACWSPDGLRIAVAIKGSKSEEHGRLEIVNLDGTHRTLLTFPSQEIADMPDWR